MNVNKCLLLFNTNSGLSYLSHGEKCVSMPFSIDSFIGIVAIQ